MTSQLAQLNIAKMKYEPEHPAMKPFVDNLDRINTLAENFQGFVWRLKSEEGNALAYRIFGNDKIINMSVWESLADLKQYVYKSAHAEIMKRKSEWFEKPVEAHLVLWWIQTGYKPTPEEAKERLTYLKNNGPTEYAFTIRKNFADPAIVSKSQRFSKETET